MKKCAITCLAMAAIICSAPAPACDVPVFRYALERWPTDPYHVVVFHKGDLSAEHQALIKKFEDSAANVFATPLDLNDEDNKSNERIQALWDKQSSPTLPWMVARYPGTYNPEEFVWSGTFDETAVDSWLDSPLRTEIVSRLTEGDSAVWVLLESGDKKKDDDAEEIINKHLRKLENELELPEQIEDSPWADWDAPAAKEMKIAFSLVRLDRSDPKETALVDMLLESESDLRDFDDPIVFPVYGRGRALFALVGPGINEENIIDTCVFLTGPCSCQVKNLNPGTDLLTNVDWDEAIFSTFTTDTDMPELPGTAELSSVVDESVEQTKPEEETEPVETVQAVETSVPDDAEPKSSVPARNFLIAVGGTILVIGAASLFLLRKGSA